jgi:hypothetical protein
MLITAGPGLGASLLVTWQRIVAATVMNVAAMSLASRHLFVKTSDRDILVMNLAMTSPEPVSVHPVTT